jgi:N4-gp56 family major capsid protein
MAWDTGLNVSRWAKQLAYEVGKEIYFSKFMGDTFGSMICSKTMPEGKGKDMTFGMVGLSGTVKEGDATLESNEDNLTSNEVTVTTGQRRFGVINAGKFDDSKVLYNFRKEALAQLKRVFAEDHDAQLFSALTKTSGAGAYLRADNGANTSVYAATDPEADLVAADLAIPGDISKLKKMAMLGTTKSYKMKPIRVNGKEYFILLLHPEAAYDLARNSTWINAQQYANIRGEDNPIFSGALGVYDGVVVHEHEGITTADNLGAGDAIPAARNLFMGAGAACYAKSDNMSWVEKTFDYGNKLGVAAGQIYGSAMSTFDSKDYAVIQYITARTNL